jgi:arylsulfatase A-like enzyme
VDAVVNEINGLDHSGTIKQGVPAIFGMNFQTISTAQKLPTSSSSTPRLTLAGGYEADGTTPGPLLREALGYIDTQVGRMVAAINANGLQSSTVIVLSAKHGQSPQLGSALTRIKDSTIINQLNASWAATHPSNPSLAIFSVNDDGMLIWLSDRSDAAESFAKNFLLSYNGNGSGSDGQATATDINGNPKAYTQAGNATIYAGVDAANFIGVSVNDPRVPDLIGIAQYGTVYTGGKGKIAEHGGNNVQDRHVPILISGGSVGAGGTNSRTVETTQIAPTIIRLLGLNPNDLKAVQLEHTGALPLDD